MIFIVMVPSGCLYAVVNWVRWGVRVLRGTTNAAKPSAPLRVMPCYEGIWDNRRWRPRAKILREVVPVEISHPVPHSAKHHSGEVQ